MLAEDVERYDVEHARVRRGEHDRGRRAGTVRLQPPQRDDTPSVARDEAAETVLGPRGDEIVADRLLVREEVTRHDSADGVAADILGPTRAATVAIETGHRVGAAHLELTTQDVALWLDARLVHAAKVRPTLRG